MKNSQKLLNLATVCMAVAAVPLSLYCLMVRGDVRAAMGLIGSAVAVYCVAKSVELAQSAATGRSGTTSAWRGGK
ncbi:unnamed protein product [marine sediment metagenome]|jgi:hypothetical protein|uniref:Uncharacterized protein n=1 Tax=marine sediment metagenome TaxID=412755 RepID=X1L1L4_9ZZZZ|nr:hypothetical protein [Cupriavidus basilensis]MDF3885020.1 hypothetical protein [Cupriavidus basilensis]